MDGFVSYVKELGLKSALLKSLRIKSLGVETLIYNMLRVESTKIRILILVSTVRIVHILSMRSTMTNFNSHTVRTFY